MPSTMIEGQICSAGESPCPPQKKKENKENKDSWTHAACDLSGKL